MAVKKGLGKGLGKGINALIPTDNGKKVSPKKSAVKKNTESARVETNVKDSVAEIMVKTSLVEPNKAQPRKTFDVEPLKELSESIKEVGILQPIIVRKTDDKHYEIIAGERRWRAAKLAGLKEIPVIIREYTPEQVMEVALIENIQRQDLNPIEEAKAFENLISEYGLKQDDVAKKVSKSRAQISNIIRLLKLDERVQGMLITGVLTGGHARALLSLTRPEEQLEAAKTVVNNSLSVRETEKLVQEILKDSGEATVARKKNPAKELVYRDMEKKLEKKLGSPVNIKSRDGKKGSIKIDYFTQEELERLFDKLSR